jgi:opacity protein-like surface antigen
MIKRTLTLAAVAAALVTLSACGDQPQELRSGVKQDGAPYTGVGKSQYAQGGWQVGDRNSWAQQLKARAEYGQNDYSRVANQ